jgi:hypothetical protein
MPQEWETGMVINIHPPPPKKGTKSKCTMLQFYYYKIHSNFKGKIGISDLWLLV